MPKFKFFLAFTILFFTMINISFAFPLKNLLHHSQDPVVGNPQGKITIVEFFDYQCSHCVDMGPTLDKIAASNPDVRIVYKEFPIRGPLSQYAAEMALGANLQHKYHEFHNGVFAASTILDEEKIRQIAQETGLDVPTLLKSAKSDSIKKLIRDNQKLGLDLKISGTPAFYIAKTNTTNENQVKFILGEISFVELQKFIQELT